MERMASAQSSQAHPHALYRAMLSDCLHHVFRTSRIVAAGGRQKGRNKELVPFQDTDKDPLHLAKTRLTSPRNSVKGASRTVRRGLKTITQPVGRDASSLRTVSRSRRRIRFLLTALPSARGTVKPKRDTLVGSLLRRQKATKKRLVTRTPLW